MDTDIDSGERGDEAGTGDMLLIGAVILSPAAALFFPADSSPSVRFAIGTFVALVVLSFAITWVLERRYPG